VLLNYQTDLIATSDELDSIITGFDGEIAAILRPSRQSTVESRGCVDAT